MAEGKKTKPAKPAPGAALPQNSSVGEMLRAARVAKNLSIEEVSVALRIRAAQLRVIEENNIDALPGMTYAVGFVRSYANFIGLDGVEVVRKFRAEYGQSAGHSKLTFPEPVAESRMPDPIMIGIGAFLAIVALVLWTMYSNAHNGAGKVAEQIPPPPVVTTTFEAPAESLLTPAPAAVSAPEPHAEPLPPVAAPAAVSAPEPHAEPPLRDPAVVENKPEKKVEKEADSVISIKQGKTRIMLQSSQDSWVQITDMKKGVIYKKVLRPGEQYHVPDQLGLSLVTANAGGLEIYVDGQRVQTLGRIGEIVHDVVLDPASLKKKKIRVND